MLPVVAITQNGRGAFWLFDNKRQADLSPLIQYGDVILSNPDDVQVMFTSAELPGLRSQLGLQESHRLSSIFEAMLQIAKPVPEDPHVICQLVEEDRRQMINHRRKENRMSDAATQPKPAAAPGAAKAPPKAAAVKKEAAPATTYGGYALTAKITFGKDKEGKSYGPTNNPKGGKAAARFALYRDGQTVQQAKDAGVAGADLKWDVSKGFVKIT